MAETESRSADRIRAHYEIERELSDRLRYAQPESRLGLYAEAYDALFERVPDHPQLAISANPRVRGEQVAAQLRFLRRFLKPDCVFLDVGAGDCELARTLAAEGATVYALDVSKSITQNAANPAAVTIVLSDGVSVDVPNGAVDVAYSNQLMEHLHPDDAEVQLRNIRKALAVGGCYVCVTPNRLNGPHDISKYFDEVATGFHLKEYTVRELRRTILAAGFSRVACYAHAKGLTTRVPTVAVITVEVLLQWLPATIRRRLASSRLLRSMLGIRMVAMK